MRCVGPRTHLGLHFVPGFAHLAVTGGESSLDSCFPALLPRALGPRLLLDSMTSDIYHVEVGFAKSILVSGRKQKQMHFKTNPTVVMFLILNPRPPPTRLKVIPAV